MTVAIPFLVGLMFGMGIGAAFQWLGSIEKRREHRPVIHMRGHRPAWYTQFYCEHRNCDLVMDDAGGWHRQNACYIDQDGHYWCERHLPKNTRVAERAAMKETADGTCVTHDHKCPKPWEPY